MEESAGKIIGYSYGRREAATSAVSLEERDSLEISAGITQEDHTFLQRAGEVLEDQIKQIVAAHSTGTG